MGNTRDWDAIQDDAIATLSRYVQFDTTNPPGNEMIAAEWLKSQLIQRGITSDMTLHEPAPGRGLLIGRVGGSESLKPLLLNHHMDVVAADPRHFSHPPFGGEVADGYLWGRGTLDTKGLGVMHLLALEQLVRDGVRFRRPVIFLAVPDEETGGSQGMEWLVEHAWDELNPEWVWDEGVGGLKGLLGDRPMFGITVAEKQIQHLRLVAKGESGHASFPIDDNANLTLIRAVERILEPRPMKVNEVTAAMFREMASSQRFPRSFLLRHLSNPLILRLLSRELAENKRNNAILRDTISLTMLKAGHKVNVIPEEAEAAIDCRLLPETDPIGFRHWLETTIGDERIRVETMMTSAPTSVSPIESPFFQTVSGVLKRHVADAVVFPFVAPTGSDSRFFRARNVPAYCFGPIVHEMTEMYRIHGVDERISIENLVLGVKIAYDVIYELCVA